VHSTPFEWKAWDFWGHYRTPTQTKDYYGEILQINHVFALFDTPKIGNLMIPVGILGILGCQVLWVFAKSINSLLCFPMVEKNSSSL